MSQKERKCIKPVCWDLLELIDQQKQLMDKQSSIIKTLSVRIKEQEALITELLRQQK